MRAEITSGIWKRLRLPDSTDLPCIHAVSKLKAGAGVPDDCSLELYGRINLAVDAAVSGILQHVKLDLARCCRHAPLPRTSLARLSFPCSRLSKSPTRSRRRCAVFMCVSIAKCYPLFSHPLTDHVGRGVGCDHREDAVTLVWVPRLVIITARV